MPTIFTHINVDLDAVASVWAAKKFFPGMADARIEFSPANWDGTGMKSEDVAVDIAAGGKGIKGSEDFMGITHSCFLHIIKHHAPKAEADALSHLAEFVDAQDTHGSALNRWLPRDQEHAKKILAFTGINAVLRAFQAMNPRNDLLVIKKMSEIFDGMLKAGLARGRAKKDAERAEILPGGKVAIMKNSQEYGTNAVLFERGVRVIVYVDGHNLGLIRKDTEDLRMDHPDIKKVVDIYGETNQWFAHPAGFLYCRGSRKAPVISSSYIPPYALAKTVNKLLS